MTFRLPTAIPAAVILTLVAGACQDAPVAPRAEGVAPDTARAADLPPGVRIFSGQSADSAMNAIVNAWAALGHPEYRARRDAWRAKERAPNAIAAIDVAGGGPPKPNRDEMENASKPDPRILDHHEDLYFTNPGSTIPGGVNGWMKFVGDEGKIDVGTVTFTGASWRTFPGGTIASGAGSPANCRDVIFAECGATKVMEGALVLQRAPSCDANGQAYVSYMAFNVSGSQSALGPLTGSQTVAASTAPVFGTAPHCSGDTNGDSGTGDGGTGDPSPPWTPSDQPPPAAPAPIPTQFHCETVEWWDAQGQMLGEQTTCYN